ncbi:MAG TPA: LptA/OstA family protein, partial [Stellaceae bacterium]|nr:LptA/OstA family protein [Stellaceae bacterium]
PQTGGQGPGLIMQNLRFAALLLGGGLALLSGAAPARAQLGMTDNGTPVNVQADNGIEWQQNQQLYIARGNAVATRGPASIKADTLIAHYRKVSGPAAANTENNSEIYRIEAEGNVVITRDTRTVVGDHADYDMDQGIGIVTGKALKMTTATDVITARDALEWYDQKQIAVARGNAVAVRQGGRTIKGDILTAYMVKSPQQQAAAPSQPAKPSPPPARPAVTAPGANANGSSPAPSGNDDSKINRIDAQGHVVVVNGLDIGRGDYGVYNAVTDICTLLGNVTVTRGNDVATGQYAVMDMKTNISRIMPASTLPGSTRQRVQGLFVKQDVTGPTPGSAPSAPNAPNGGAVNGAPAKGTTANGAAPKGP